ncbi:hypothetical protein ACI45T_004386 [Vibrio vulnificus]|nr:hypothetical protein [Vibrio vulnificus]KOO13226.1 hypothetical protein AKJ18_19680 [Vibrio xuii]
MADNTKTPMFGDWGAFTLNPDFTAKYKYHEKLTVHGQSVVNIPLFAKNNRVPNHVIIGNAISNNIAIPRQPKKQEGKIRGKSGELLFEALVEGSIDMNEVEFDHEGWDFEVERSGCKVEVKTTAPDGNKSGNANLSQGDKPDIYIIFKFNNTGRFSNAYLVPVDVMKARTGRVPSSLKINENSWVTRFEISLKEIQLFFELAQCYPGVFSNFNYKQHTDKVVLKYPYCLDLVSCFCREYSFDVNQLFVNPEKWWRIYLGVRATTSNHEVPVNWCWSHI